jgi:hypothetical protein
VRQDSGRTNKIGCSAIEAVEIVQHRASSKDVLGHFARKGAKTMKKAYIDKTFRPTSLNLIVRANDIIDEFAVDGYELTLRQLYYQFVSRDIIANKQSEYKRLGSVINDARLAGLVDWESIVDRTRKYEELDHWESPEHILESCAEGYRVNTREGQEHYIEVWVEKDALVGIVEQACAPLDVGYLSCRGYVSQSAMWRASIRFRKMERAYETFLIHLGDHDPSGIDMTRDIQDRLEMFESDVTVERIALNMDQIEQYNPPPNPAKTTDSRYQDYRDEHGEDSWELDALDPHILTELISEAVARHTDEKERQILIEAQEQDRQRIQELADNWED